MKNVENDEMLKKLETQRDRFLERKERKGKKDCCHLGVVAKASPKKEITIIHKKSDQGGCSEKS